MYNPNLTHERCDEIINNLIGWASEHDKEFFDCFIAAAGFSEEEIHQMSLDEVF